MQINLHSKLFYNPLSREFYITILMKVTILQVKKWHKNAFFVHNSPCQIAVSLRRVFLKLSW